MTREQQVSGGKPSVLREATVCGYHSFIAQATLPILFLKSNAEVEPDTGRSVVAHGSFWDNE